MPLLRAVLRPLAACMLSGVLSGWLGTPTRAQEAPAPPAPLDAAAVLGDVAAPPAVVAPALPPPVLVENQPAPSVLGIIGASLFGEEVYDKNAWRPLSLSTFFTEGWNEPFVWAPVGSGGAARGGWINAFEGVFFRTWYVNFLYANNFDRGGTRFLSNYTLYAPMSRRFEFRIDVPFLVSTSKGGAEDTYHTHFGDLVITPRFLLSETQDFSQVVALNIRTPTGSTANGNGVTSLTAQYQFWANVAGPWVVRGGTGVMVPTSDTGARTNYFVDLGVGQYFARKEAAFFHDFYWYFVTNMNTTLDNRGPNATFVAFTPGVRFALTRDHLWHFLAAVEVPVTGPKAFDYQPILLLLKNY